nr:unnamed protein product [Digitaria exilis]
MAPFDFDLNELPPEDDGSSDTSPARAPEPTGVPSPHDLLPAPVPESSPHEPLQASASAPQSSAHDLPPAPVPEPSPHDLPAAAVSEPSAHDLPPVPAAEPSPRDPLPDPVPDADSRGVAAQPAVTGVGPGGPTVFSLDDDDDDDGYDFDEEDLPPPPPGPPPFGQAAVVAAAAPARSSSSVDTPSSALPIRWNRRRERTSRQPFGLSSPEDPVPRGRSRTASGTELYARRDPYTYDDDDPRGDMMISSKQRRVDDDYDGDEDARSSLSGSRRSELASPPQFEQGGRRHAPATHGHQPPGAPPRNRRRRRRPQQGYQHPGPVEKQPARGREQQQQGFRGQERPKVHQGYRGPHGPEVTKVGYSSSPGPFVRLGSSDVRRHPEREPPINNGKLGNGGYHQTPPVRAYSRPHGREDSYNGQQSQVQEAPKVSYREAPKVSHREAPSFRPSSGAHGNGMDSGGRRQAPAQRPTDVVGAYQQKRKAPRGRERFPDRSYHPYARDGGAFYKNDGGGHRAKREPQHNYERPGDSKRQRTSSGWSPILR